jgi:hypothetical protein
MTTQFMTSRRRRVLRIAAILAPFVLCGCASESRPVQTRDELLAVRARSAASTRESAAGLLTKLVERTKRDYDDFAAKRTSKPTVDILVISGGGDWGAFGAGFLKGWGRVPAGDPMARPEFDVVTGVSTGALIAPFAFVGTEESIDRIETLYRNPQSDWVRERGWLYFLPSNISFAEIPGLERDVKANIDTRMIAAIAQAGASGRALVVNTTNLDDGNARVFDLVSEAERAVAAGDTERVQTIILASAGIPAAFPFRMIDNQMYVDGGVTGNIVYGGRLSEDASLPALWAKAYPGLVMPKLRYWVIFNNQLAAQPQVTAPNWPGVVSRSVSLAIQAATVSSIRHLYALAEISRLKRHADVEVRVAAIPDDWLPPKPGVFIKETMNNLADLGERMGADPSSWTETIETIH